MIDVFFLNRNNNYGKGKDIFFGGSLSVKDVPLFSGAGGVFWNVKLVTPIDRIASPASMGHKDVEPNNHYCFSKWKPGEVFER